MKSRIGWTALLPVFAGCGFAYGAGAGVVHEEVYYDEAAYASYGGVYFDVDYARRVNYRRLPVPRGHLPRAGRCRIWLPGVPPGQQPRHGSCRSLQRRVPLGAWLLHRSRDVPGIVELTHFDARRTGVYTRHLYDVRSGRRVNPW
ncbi:MAG: hypothetical protein OEU54_03125 [Gemmatimonadota bacterium]|nr:hypothetical protein [Gemmatimonadota bacterium]